MDYDYRYEDFVERLIYLLKGIGKIDKLCIAIPGTVNPYSNFIIKCPNLRYWRDLDLSNLKETLQDKGLFIDNVYISNDANAGCVGAYKIMKIHKENIVYIAIGTGIGAGAIINQKLLIGKNYSAMELGHTKIDRKSYICGCGSIGCIETFCSSRALYIYYNSKKNKQYSNLLSLIQNENKTEIYNLFHRFSKYLSILINNIIYTIDPDYIFISGKVVLSSKFFKRRLINQIKKKITMINNYDLDRIKLLDDVEKYNTYNLVGSIYASDFI